MVRRGREHVVYYMDRAGRYSDNEDDEPLQVNADVARILHGDLHLVSLRLEDEIEKLQLVLDTQRDTPITLPRRQIAAKIRAMEESRALVKMTYTVLGDRDLAGRYDRRLHDPAVRTLNHAIQMYNGNVAFMRGLRDDLWEPKMNKDDELQRQSSAAVACCEIPLYAAPSCALPRSTAFNFLYTFA